MDPQTISRLEGEYLIAKQVLANAQSDYNAKKFRWDQARGVVQEVAPEQPVKAPPVVTEHAMLRYIERVLKIDRYEFKERILTPEVVDWINRFKSGRFPHPECFLIVKNRVVVTVAPKE